MFRRISQGYIVFMLGLFCLLSFNTSLADESGNALKDYANDSRYNSLKEVVVSSGYFLDEINLRVDTTPEGLAILIPVLNSDTESTGLIVLHQYQWILTLQFPDTVITYSATKTSDGAVEVKQYDHSHLKLEPMTGPEAPMCRAHVLNVASMTGPNWCMYTSKVGLNVGCFDWDGNPFGYYHVTTYREGDTIRWNWYTWRANWQGRSVACPRNEKSWSPVNWVQCGFPPN